MFAYAAGGLAVGYYAWSKFDGEHADLAPVLAIAAAGGALIGAVRWIRKDLGR
jgi:hypothetical protein